ncbi:MAG: GNAT family N-acetyltransferase [Thiomicrospira sp.]|jgi:anti-sigma regulatory factor (Ser/Thr protein kinase)/predicted N-acetyltransferase YhbS|nr:GNAT family N-acetyltransferase [Thiomicrospira sp.]
MRAGCEWVHLTLPAALSSLPTAQALVAHVVTENGFDGAKNFSVQLALEEVFTTILRYAYEDDDAQATIELQLSRQATLLQLAVISHGLPFEWSMIPDYDPSQVWGVSDEALGLSAFLLKNSVDRYRLLNQGKQGIRFELSWALPSGHIADMEETVGAASDVKTEVSPLAHIRPLTESEAIQLARLVYRSYGYSYVYEDMYYPERIVSKHQAGLLHSWVAVARSGELIGHIALMKPTLDEQAVEWGIAVVDPRWRGGGVMQALLKTLLEALDNRSESVAYAHAVTSHTYTQKTCIKFGFQPTALQLCLVPCLSYKHIKEAKQRESTFISVRCLRPLPQARLFLPVWHRARLVPLLKALEADGAVSDEECIAYDDVASRWRLQQQALASAQSLSANTQLRSEIVSHANLALLEVVKIGADQAQVLASELKRVCLEKVDVVQLSVDLTDPGSPGLVAAAEQLGFFMSGLMPMMPKAYSLTLQYLNNLSVDYEAIQAEGEQASAIKDWVRFEQQMSEQLQLRKLDALAQTNNVN